MPQNVFWKGYLRLSLVTCAVRLQPATTESGRVRLHTLSRQTHNRVVSEWVDETTGQTVPDDEAARGFQTGDDAYLLIEDDDIDAVALDSARTIDIETFAPAGSIGWVWRDRPYFLTPADEVGAEAFAVIRAAMEAAGRVGIGRLVLARRERAVLLEPRGPGIVLWSLRFGDEVRPAPAIPPLPDEPDPQALKLVTRLIRQRQRDWSPEMVRDPVEGALGALIAKRRKSDRRRAAKDERAGGGEGRAPAEEGGKVIDIMDALRRSIARGERG